MFGTREARHRVEIVGRKIPTQWRIASMTCVYGPDLGPRVVELTRAAGWGRCFCIADPTVLCTKDAEGFLSSFSPGSLTVWTGVEPHVPEASVGAGVDAAKRANPGWILSIGGGSAHDTAKLVALQLAHDGAQLQSFAADGPSPLGVLDVLKVLPLVTMPSTLAGAEVTGVAGFISASEGRKRVVVSGSAVPRLVVLSPELIASAPIGIFVATGLNAVHHVLEAWMGLKANAVSDAFAATAGQVLLPALSLGLGDRQFATSIAGTALFGAHLAGHALWASGSAVGHALCHVLGGVHGIPHGVANAIVLPRVTAFYAAREPKRLADLLNEWHCGMTAKDFIGWTVELMSSAGLPRTLANVGLSDSNQAAIATAASHERQFSNTRDVTAGDRDLLTLVSNLWEEDFSELLRQQRIFND